MTPQREGEQRKGLQKLIDTLPSNLIGVEIGSYAGESALMFMGSGKFNKLYCVDPWVKVEHAKEAERSFDKLIKGFNIVKLKGTINTFIDTLPKIDFCYIDGNHSYQWVKNDIVQIKRIIKKGGIIAGHDYTERYSERVVKAVKEELGTPDLIFSDSSWIKYYK